MTDPEELASKLIADLGAGAGIATVMEQLSHLEPDAATQVLEAMARHEEEDVVRWLEGVATGDQPSLVVPAVEALRLHRTPSAAYALARIADGAGDKQLRKLARRNLHRLRAAGIALPEAPPVVSAPGVVRPSVRYYKGVVTSLDGEGTRAVMVGAERPSGIVDGVFALINEEEGLKECYALETSRKGFDRQLDDAQKQMSNVTWLPAPPAYCHHLVREYADRARARGALSPERERCARVLGEPRTSYCQALIYERLPAREVRGNPLLLQRGPAVLQELEFHGWVLDPDTMRSYAVAMSEARQSPLVLSEWIKAEREKRIVDRAIDEVFDAPLLASYARRLEEMSYVLLETRREESARVALATALALREEPKEAAHSNPFLRALTVQSIEFALERGLRGRGKIITPSL